MTAVLPGATVVVTGATGGIGRAIVDRAASAGATVHALDRTPDEGDPGVGVRRHELDVADEEHWTRFAAQLERTLDGETLRGLVLAAGITHRARIGSVARADWDRVLAVNLTGALLGIQALAPLMSSGSSIVLIGSSAGLTAHYPVAYSVSKWGLRGLAAVAAAEYGPAGIRVNTVHPGFIETPMTANAPAAMREAQLELTPLERLGHPDEVAATVAFLLSDAASYISGAEVPVDGAYTAVGGAKRMADRIAAAQHDRND